MPNGILTLLFSSRSMSPCSKKDKPPRQHLLQNGALSTCPMHNSSSRVRAMQPLPPRGKLPPKWPELKMLKRQTWSRKSQLRSHASQEDTRECRTLPSLLKRDLIGCRQVRPLRIPPSTSKELAQDQIRIFRRDQNRWGLGAALLSAHARYAWKGILVMAGAEF